MKIDVITVWYNESYLSRYFLGHYSFANKIHVVVDTDTNDDTREILSGFNNVVVHDITFTNGFDGDIKIGKINQLYRESTSDWVICVDSDEFVFPLPLGVDISTVLAAERNSDVIFSRMWQVYRHRSDSDLDPTLPAITQRRHGDPNVTEGVNRLYTKPIVVRAGLDLRWAPGCHHLRKSKNSIRRLYNKITGFPKISDTVLAGVHWAMADPNYVVERKIHGRKNRFGANNIERGYGSHLLDITEESLRRDCDAHLDDPKLF